MYSFFMYIHIFLSHIFSKRYEKSSLFHECMHFKGRLHASKITLLSFSEIRYPGSNQNASRPKPQDRRTPVGTLLYLHPLRTPLPPRDATERGNYLSICTPSDPLLEMPQNEVKWWTTLAIRDTLRE